MMGSALNNTHNRIPGNKMIRPSSGAVAHFSITLPFRIRTVGIDRQRAKTCSSLSTIWDDSLSF